MLVVLERVCCNLWRCGFWLPFVGLMGFLPRLEVLVLPIWLWLKKPLPKWNPGKWKHGPKPAVCSPVQF